MRVTESSDHSITKRHVRRLVDGLDGYETQPPIEPQGAFVLGGHFQVDAADAGLGKPCKAWKSRIVPRPPLRCSGTMPRFWMAPGRRRRGCPARCRRIRLRPAPRPEVKSQVVRPGSRACERSRASGGGSRPTRPGRGRHWRRSRRESSGTWPRQKPPARWDSRARNDSPQAPWGRQVPAGQRDFHPIALEIHKVHLPGGLFSPRKWELSLRPQGHRPHVLIIGLFRRGQSTRSLPCRPRPR